MKKALTIGVLTATVLTAVFLTMPVPAFASGDRSETTIPVETNQKAVVSGFKPNVQNCAPTNLDALPIAGDEGVDCHNQRDSQVEQSASD
jgi:hypothetical protein